VEAALYDWIKSPESPYNTKSRGNGCASGVERGAAARMLADNAIAEMACVAVDCASMRTRKSA
jgi:hypothetical protein